MACDMALRGPWWVFAANALREEGLKRWKPLRRYFAEEASAAMRIEPRQRPDRARFCLQRGRGSAAELGFDVFGHMARSYAAR